MKTDGYYIDSENMKAVPPMTPIQYYWHLWDGLNAKRGHGWDANPWVWVYDFEQIEKPEETQ